MKVLRVTISASDERDAEGILKDIHQLSNDKGFIVLFADIDDPEDHHLAAAKELGLLPDSEGNYIDPEW